MYKLTYKPKLSFLLIDIWLNSYLYFSFLMFWCTKNRRLGMIVMPVQDLKFLGKQIFRLFLIFLRLVFASDGVGVAVGVIRELMAWWKLKIGVVSRVISSTESESEESERFHFRRFRLQLRRLWSSETRLSKSEAEAEEPANRKARNRTISLVYSSASACDSDNAVSLDRSENSCFWYIKNSYRTFYSAVPISTLWRFYRAPEILVLKR